MTNLIAKVREMREVGDFVATTAEMDTLLRTLGGFQAGDAKRLAGLIRWQTINEECSQDEIDMLDRLHEMACKMERPTND